jgi:hypothetical protein
MHGFTSYFCNRNQVKHHNMKKQTIFGIIPFTFAFLLLGSLVMAQQSQTDDKEQAARDAEMKAKQEQLEFQRQEMKEQQLKAMEMEKEFAVQARQSARASSSDRSRSTARVYSSGIAGDAPYFFVAGDQENQSSLTLRNSFNGTSDSSQGEFDVDETTSHIRCTINGKVRSGEITVKVLYPGGKVFKNLSITSSAEISFTQSLSINQEDHKKYVGSWKYEVTADKAEGSYNLSFVTH